MTKGISKLSQLLHLEWLRNPPSRLEVTLRWPFFLRNILILFLKRWILKGVVIAPLCFLGLGCFPFSLLVSFLFIGCFELFSLHRWYAIYVLPKYIHDMKEVIKLYKKRYNSSASELVHIVEEMCRKSSWGVIRIVYMAFPSWGWEVIFKLLYPVFVKGKKIRYHKLLLGFGNQYVENMEFQLLLEQRM